MTKEVVIQVGRIHSKLETVALRVGRRNIWTALKVAELKVQPWEWLSLNGEEIKETDFAITNLEDGDRVMIREKHNLFARIQKFFGGSK